MHSSMYFDAFIFDSKSVFKLPLVVSVIAKVFNFFTSAAFFLIDESIFLNFDSTSFSFSFEDVLLEEDSCWSPPPSSSRKAEYFSFVSLSFLRLCRTCALNSRSLFFFSSCFLSSSFLFASVSIRIFSFASNASRSMLSLNRRFSSSVRGFCTITSSFFFFFFPVVVVVVAFFEDEFLFLVAARLFVVFDDVNDDDDGFFFFFSSFEDDFFLSSSSSSFLVLVVSSLLPPPPRRRRCPPPPPPPPPPPRDITGGGGGVSGGMTTHVNA